MSNEPEHREDIVEAVLDRRPGKSPRMDRVKLLTRKGGAGVAVLDNMRFIQNDSPEFNLYNRQLPNSGTKIGDKPYGKSPSSATVYPTRSPPPHQSSSLSASS